MSAAQDERRQMSRLEISKKFREMSKEITASRTVSAEMCQEIHDIMWNVRIRSSDERAHTNIKSWLCNFHPSMRCANFYTVALVLDLMADCTENGIFSKE